jgi:transposase
MQKIPRRRFTDDFRAQALALAASVGPAAAARKLGMSVKTLANWIAGRSGPVTAPASTKRRPTTELEAELAQLRSENAMLKMEREILKKATAFFAKESK